MAETRNKHGLTPLMARVSARGIAAVDGRSRAMRAVSAWKQELLADLGGAPAVSAQKLAIVDMAVRTRLYIDHVDAYLLEQKSLVNRRSKAILPILRERTQLVDSLARMLNQLGLDRVEHDGGTLPESWIEKVQPHHESEPETKGAPHVDESKNG